MPPQVYPRSINESIETCIQLSERGGTPERINGSSLAAMDGTGPMGNAIVLLCCCFRGVACRHLPVGMDEQDVRRKMPGGIFPRGLSEGVSPSNGGACSPGSVCRGRFAYSCGEIIDFPGGAAAPPDPPGLRLRAATSTS